MALREMKEYPPIAQMDDFTFPISQNGLNNFFNGFLVIERFYNQNCRLVGLEPFENKMPAVCFRGAGPGITFPEETPIDDSI